MKKTNKKTKSKRNQIKNLKKELNKKRIHIRNKIKDFHNKTIKYICENYENIIMPKLNSKAIAKKMKRIGMKKQGEKIIELSHSKFIERLKTKIEVYKGRKLYIVSEEYTSKTCGKCGIINRELGSNRTFNCKECDYKSDRDINASRNILIKFLTGKK